VERPLVQPRNNVNYGDDVLSTTTRACEAPFYATIPENEATRPALACQRRYADLYASVVEDHPNVVCDVSNESRATLEWSTYWAEYIREAIDADRLVGDMRSTNREDGSGQCDPRLQPATLFEDDRYDYADCSQALSAHSFGGDVHDLVAGTRDRVAEYYERMAAADPEPIVVSKDYTFEAPDGRPVIWSKFVAGAATARFHRPTDGSEETAAFDFECIERPGSFVADTTFRRHRPDRDVVVTTPPDAVALARSWPGEEYVVAVVDGGGGDLAVALAPGTYAVRRYDPPPASPPPSAGTAPPSSGRAIRSR
jgi:hypothetical protein